MFDYVLGPALKSRLGPAFRMESRMPKLLSRIVLPFLLALSTSVCWACPNCNIHNYLAKS
jgi:hypothetical protein